MHALLILASLQTLSTHALFKKELHVVFIVQNECQSITLHSHYFVEEFKVCSMFWFKYSHNILEGLSVEISN